MSRSGEPTILEHSWPLSSCEQLLLSRNGWEPPELPCPDRQSSNNTVARAQLMRIARLSRAGEQSRTLAGTAP